MTDQMRVTLVMSTAPVSYTELVDSFVMIDWDENDCVVAIHTLDPGRVEIDGEDVLTYPSPR